MPEISDRQRRVHVVAETAALVIVVPGLVAIAASPKVPKSARVFAGTVAAGTVAVDGWLLWKFKQQQRKTS